MAKIFCHYFMQARYSKRIKLQKISLFDFALFCYKGISRVLYSLFQDEIVVFQLGEPYSFGSNIFQQFLRGLVQPSRPYSSSHYS